MSWPPPRGPARSGGGGRASRDRRVPTAWLAGPAERGADGWSAAWTRARELARRARAALAAARDQRHRRDPAHEPRAGAAGRERARGRRARPPRVLEPRARPRVGRARQPPRPRRGPAVRADRRRGAIVVNNGAGAVLLAAAALAGPGTGDRGVARAAGRDRRRVPDPRRDRPVGRAADRGGHHQPHPPAATTSGRCARRRRGRRDHARAPVELPDASGSCEDVPIEALCELGVPVIDDVGSGGLAGAAVDRGAGRRARPCARSVAAGAALVCCSGDKLLGGPQAGLIVGRREAVAAARRHPLARALRIDKLSLAALEATLRLYRDPERARTRDSRAGDARRGRGDAGGAGASGSREAIGEPAQIVAAVGAGGRRGAAAARARGTGGGAARREPEALARALREHEPPVIARIHDGRRAARPAHADRGRGRRSWSRGRAGARSTDELAAADARHRRPHRPRQDRADPRADRRRHRPPARGARARDLDRARLRAASSCRPGAGCRWSTSPVTSGSCARWSPAPPASTCS